MKILYVLLILCEVYTPFIIAQEWVHIETKGDIEVYRKDGEKDDLPIFRSTTTIIASLSDIKNQILDYDHYKSWIDGCYDSRILEHELNTNEARYGYVKQKTPWPLKNIDAVSLIQIDFESTDSIHISFTSLPEFIPRNTKYNRLQSLNGKWILKKLSRNKVSVVYQATFTIPIKLPKFWAIKIMRKAAISLLKGLKSSFE